MQSDLFPSYATGTAPGHAPASDTSAEAAESVAPSLGERQVAVLRVLRSLGALTGEQVADVLRRPTYTVLPRLTELSLQGLVRDTGERGRNRSGRKATVWSITEQGREVASQNRTDPLHQRSA